MGFKNFFGAIGLAALGMFAVTSSANAVVVGAFDGGNDFDPVPLPTLTLDINAVDTALFDTTSTSFNLIGAGAGAQTFTFLAEQDVVFTTGNLVIASSFSTAEISVNGTVYDLLANPDVFVSISVPLAPTTFDVVTNFVLDASKTGGQASYDFTVSTVPLPAGMVLLLTALGGLGFVARRKALAA